MDSLNLERFVHEALKLSPDKGNGYGFALAVVVSMGLFCIVGFIFVLKRYERYRDKQDAAREQQWKDENESRIKARAEFTAQIDTRFDKLELATDQAFDAIEVEAKAMSELVKALDKRIDRLEWEKKQGKLE